MAVVARPPFPPAVPSCPPLAARAAATDVQGAHAGGHPGRPGRDLAGRDARGTRHRLSAVLGHLGAAGCATGGPTLSLQGHSGPTLCRTFAAQPASPTPGGPGPGDGSGARARGRAAPRGQAEAGSRTAVRVCPHPPAAPARIDAVGRQPPGVYRGAAACTCNRLRGSRAPPDTRSTAPPPGPGAWRRLAGVARAPSQKTIANRARAHRCTRASPAARSAAHVL
jgi:hypothetical protein